MLGFPSACEHVLTKFLAPAIQLELPFGADAAGSSLT